MAYPNAIKNCQIDDGDHRTGLCLMKVRMAFKLDANGHEPTAHAAWLAEGGTDGPNTHTQYPPPPNVPVFWTGGSTNAGHVAIADGKGNVWSTDVKRPGEFDLVPIDWIHEHWHLNYAGWTETLEGHRIHAHIDTSKK